MTYFENKENIKVDLKKFKNLVVEYYRYISNICLCYDDKNFEQLRDKYIFIKEFLETLGVKVFDNNSTTPERYYWYLAWSGLTRKSVKTWNYFWPNYPSWPPTNPAPSVQ